jgi:predicted glycosyltransferase
LGRVDRVWVDALTSKQGVLLGVLARELLASGFDVLVTCREYEFTCRVLEYLGLEYLAVGKYSEGDSYSKVFEDAVRMSALVNTVRSFSPKFLIAYPNPSAARVAFGAGIRYIALTDSPHSVIPSRLSLPLADVVVFSGCIPKSEVLAYVSERFTKVLTYRGVDEVGWIKRLKPSENDVRALGLKPWGYVVFRPAEEMATYYRSLSLIPPDRVLDVLVGLGYDVVLLPRYSKHAVLRREGVVVLEKGFSGPSLTYYSRLVVSGGASMAREAALMGTPAITYTPLDLPVNRCVEDWGFPLRRARSLRELEEMSEEMSKQLITEKERYLRLATSLEDPLTIINNLLSKEALGEQGR